MKKSLSILLGIMLVFCFSMARATPVLTVTDPVVFRCHNIDEDGYAEDADSAHVHVWHEDVGDNAITYSARTSDMTADWIGEVAYAGGKNVTMFRDVAGDIDAGAGDGLYTISVDLFIDGQRFPTDYAFYLSGTNTNTAQDEIAAASTFDPTTDSVFVDGSSFADQVGIIDAGVIADDAIDSATYADDAKKMVAIRADSGAVDIADGAITAAKIADDAIDAATFADDAQFANYGGAVWVDTTNGTAGAVVGVNGLPSLPCRGFHNAKIVADAIGAHTFCVLGGGDQSIKATMNGYTFMGIGDPARNQIDLNSQDVGGSMFIDLDITGIQGGDRAAFIRCALENASLDAVALQCGLRGDITLLGDRDNVFIGCASSEPGDKTPSLIFSGGSESVQFRGYSGGLHLHGMGANDSLSFDAIGGQLQIGAGVNVNAKISARGWITVTDSTAGMSNLIYTATAQYVMEKLGAMGLADSATIDTQQINRNIVQVLVDSIDVARDADKTDYMATGFAVAADIDSTETMITRMRDTLNATQDKTTNLPADPADDSDIDAKLAAMGLADSAAVGMATVDLGLADSAQVGVEAAKVTLADSSANDIAMMGNYHVLDSTLAKELDDSLGSQGWAASSAGTVPDSTLNDIAMMGNYHVADSTLAKEVDDSLGSQGWAATSAAYGSGAQVDSLFVIDTSGTDTKVVSVSMTIKNAALSSDIAYSLSTGDAGFVNYNLDASTEYNAVCRRPGYTFDIYNFTTGAGATHNDTILGYNISIGTATPGTLKRVYDYIYSADSDTLGCGGITVTAELVMPSGSGAVEYQAYDSTALSLVVISPAPLTASTNTSCMFYFDLFPNQIIQPDDTRWHFKATQGGKPIYDMTVSLTGTSTERISALHRAQVD